MSKYKWPIITFIILAIAALAMLVMYLDFAADMNHMATPYSTSTINIPATLTQIAKPTRTPPPPPTPDTRTQFEKCASQKNTTIYLLYGTASWVDATWTNDTNGTEQSSLDIPACLLNKFEPYEPAYIEKIIVDRTGPTITGRIILYYPPGPAPPVIECESISRAPLGAPPHRLTILFTTQTKRP